jgi:hypothetical protein
MTIAEWLDNALKDAERRNLPALRPLLGELPETPPEHVR